MTILLDFDERIDVHNPENYFENFYSIVWQANFGQTAADEPIRKALDIAIKEYGGVGVDRTYFYEYRTYRYVAKFKSDEDITFFKLRFS